MRPNQKKGLDSLKKKSTHPMGCWLLHSSSFIKAINLIQNNWEQAFIYSQLDPFGLQPKPMIQQLILTCEELTSCNCKAMPSESVSSVITTNSFNPGKFRILVEISIRVYFNKRVRFLPFDDCFGRLIHKERARFSDFSKFYLRRAIAYW